MSKYTNIRYLSDCTCIYMPKLPSAHGNVKASKPSGKDITSQSCWEGYKKTGTHTSNGNRVNTCIKKK